MPSHGDKVDSAVRNDWPALGPKGTMNQFGWYAAYTYPRHEKQVVHQLALRDIESFLPSYYDVHKWRNGCKVRLQLPLFPGYVFVRIRLDELSRVLQVPSLAYLVGFRDVPVALPSEEIEALRAALLTLNAEPHPFIRVGDRVRVRSGCLAGTEGVLVRKATGLRFVLNVDLIKQAASLEINPDNVEPIDSLSQFPRCGRCPTASEVIDHINPGESNELHSSLPHARRDSAVSM